MHEGPGLWIGTAQDTSEGDGREPINHRRTDLFEEQVSELWCEANSHQSY